MLRVLSSLFFLIVAAFAADYDEILKNKNIKIGVSTNMPPFSKISGSKFEGFEIDFAKALVEKIFPNDVKITFVGVEQSNRKEAVKNSEVDILIAAYTRNENRAKEVDFSIPYFSIILSTVSKKASNIKNEADLRYKKVAVIKNTNSYYYLVDNGYNILECKDNFDCFKKVKNDEAVAFMHNIVSTATIPIIDPNFEVSLKFPKLSFMDCVATQKGNTTLIEKINKSIIELSKEGFFRQNYENTFATFYKGKLDKKYFILDDFYSLIF
ncbi:transporter substrate-binding domain-containing protein [Campylobacter sp. FMV-PI01]|uniref:Transporter substrate-binding domain-containing protein n=1 Tax=Campylobacter portucalensis TaxID=2608384 RepID=A0A6L5WL51_9BACT|nr:transporter substrate-binding domain-containing protein [Campylobacter portucalensis]MSN96451.1 transporter substrate-binding domain-containing protein [Campylobacter portucalensis]